MGCRVTDMDGRTVYTDRKVSDRAVGERVWLITGEGKRPRSFYLRSSFVIDSIGPSDRPGLQTQVKGSKGRVWNDPMPLLNDEDWFSRFKKTQFFSHGFQ